MSKRIQERPDLETTLKALKEGEESSVSATVFYGLSHLSERESAELQDMWEGLSQDYRRKIMRRLGDIGEANLEMDYRAVGMMALDDSDAGVREAAIDVLFEDMSLALMDKLVEIAQWDDAPEVRAAAVSALGRFIIAGELEELPESETTRAQDAAVSLLTNDEEDIDVRRRALEAIANCSHEIVEEAITEAYHSDEHKMRVSALFAMGRSCDERWNPMVVRELQSPDPEMRFEAARAAGELSTEEAVPTLVRLAFDSDGEVKEVAIWSLGEIGGLDAKRALNKLVREAQEADDADLLEAVEDALANAQLVDSLDTLDEYDD